MQATDFICWLIRNVSVSLSFPQALLLLFFFTITDWWRHFSFWLTNHFLSSEKKVTLSVKWIRTRQPVQQDWKLAIVSSKLTVTTWSTRHTNRYGLYFGDLFFWSNFSFTTVCINRLWSESNPFPTRRNCWCSIPKRTFIIASVTSWWVRRKATSSLSKRRPPHGPQMNRRTMTTTTRWNFAPKDLGYVDGHWISFFPPIVLSNRYAHHQHRKGVHQKSYSTHAIYSR